MSDFRGGVILFNHVYKAGGMTFSRLLHRYYRRNLDTNFLRSWGRLAEGSVQPRPTPLLVTGHYAPGVEKLLPWAGHVTRLTMLRDPVAALRSAYGFGLEGQLHTRSVDLFLRFATPNRFTHALGGGDLEAAKRNLEENYAFFGLVERYRESVALLSGVLGIPIGAFTPLNASRSGVEDFSPENLELIKLRHRADLELHRFALNLFERRCGDGARETAQNLRERRGRRTFGLPYAGERGHAPLIEAFRQGQDAVHRGDGPGALKHFSLIFPGTSAAFPKSPFVDAAMATQYLWALRIGQSEPSLRRGIEFARMLIETLETLGSPDGGEGLRWLLSGFYSQLGELCRSLGDSEGVRRAYAGCFAHRPRIFLHGRPLPEINVKEALRGAGRILVVRSAPKEILEQALSLCGKHAGTGASLTLALRADSDHSVTQHYGVTDTIDLPPYWFQYREELREWLPSLYEKPFDAMVILHDGVNDCVDYAEWLKLAAAIAPRKTWFFSAARAGFGGKGEAGLFQVEEPARELLS